MIAPETVSAPAAVETDITDETDFVGNGEFLLAVFGDERGEINHRRLGWWIRRHAGRIVDGRRFIRASGNRSAEAWQVESVSPVSSVSSAPGRESVSGATDSSNAYARASRGA